MNYATALASRLASRSPSVHTLDKDDRASIASSQGTSPSASESSSLSSLETPSSSFSDPLSGPSVTRRYEHLAVLLPKRLWKPDQQAARCSVFLCRKQFSIFERKHHCRKCGDVVCGTCSTRSTLLLDTSNLDFFYPPRDTPISVYASPISPVSQERVCDHCWDQVHGVVTPRSPLSYSASPVALHDSPRDTHSPASSVSSSSGVHTPPDILSPIARPALRRSVTASPASAGTSSPRPPSSPLRSPVQSSQALSAMASVHVADHELAAVDKPAEADLGELESYPLRRASQICKATGGGRWAPKQYINLIGDHLPGQKPQYLIELEWEEAERRRRKANPVYESGDFKLRVPREVGPRSPGGPVNFSTF
ncbi:FYVE zinc finger-domain-containing protein [Fomitopsis serialis]|uniref:FYVE zinc finger-domain-containing protein n=1 Tax=Fomitopsis serialis TaxID=139415 RepID=UPI002007D418|nr:FYVE zinc finger-domain-containing protein [Neoantrodia serialis]KAH9921303.1 FYVE zinc finger-domain-containing protein [Neoantrodia serialis]